MEIHKQRTGLSSQVGGARLYCKHDDRKLLHMQHNGGAICNGGTELHHRWKAGKPLHRLQGNEIVLTGTGLSWPFRSAQKESSIRGRIPTSESKTDSICCHFCSDFSWRLNNDLQNRTHKRTFLLQRFNRTRNLPIIKKYKFMIHNET